MKVHRGARGSGAAAPALMECSRVPGHQEERFSLPRGVACTAVPSWGCAGELCAPRPSSRPGAVVLTQVWTGPACPELRAYRSHSLLSPTRARPPCTLVPPPIVWMGPWSASTVADRSALPRAPQHVSLVPELPAGVPPVGVLAKACGGVPARLHVSHVHTRAGAAVGRCTCTWQWLPSAPLTGLWGVLAGLDTPGRPPGGQQSGRCGAHVSAL